MCVRQMRFHLSQIVMSDLFTLTRGSDVTVIRANVSADFICSVTRKQPAFVVV